MVRTQETRFAKWTEFEGLDSNQPLWRLSPERMKMSREHLVPLSRQVIDILWRLKEISRSSLYLFAADSRHGVMSENTMLFALYRMGYHSRQTTHGLRRCAGLYPVLKTPSLVFLWSREVGHGETEVHTRVQA
jgi:integrase